MSTTRRTKVLLAAGLALLLVIGGVLVARTTGAMSRVSVVGYFANSNGVFVGDDVKILGIPVGKITAIEPEPLRSKISFWINKKYKVPADVNALVISPSLVTARAIQLSPVYKGGPTLKTGAVIPEQRTAVPVEFDDLRQQLEKLTESLKPSVPGGVSTLGAFVQTGAANMRGQGQSFREALIGLSQSISALGDHSGDTFATIKNLSTLTSALQTSTGLMGELNQNLSAVTALLANDPTEISRATTSINDVVGDFQSFIADSRDTLGTTVEKLASLTTALNESREDIKQTLHIAPTAFANFTNIYQPAQGSLSGAIVLNNFANPIAFICGAIQAASRLGAEQSAKLCVQYLAPIMKNRQFNFPPLGENILVGTQARPNEITYSEDRLRPDYVPPAVGAPAPAALPAEAITADPAAGLGGMMIPAGGGS